MPIFLMTRLLIARRWADVLGCGGLVRPFGDHRHCLYLSRA